MNYERIPPYVSVEPDDAPVPEFKVRPVVDDPCRAYNLVIVLGYENAHDMTGAAKDASSDELKAALQAEFDRWPDRTGVFIPAPKTPDDLVSVVKNHMTAYGIDRLDDIQIISHGYPEVLTPLKPQSEHVRQKPQRENISFIPFMPVAAELAPLTQHLDTTACRLFSRITTDDRACYAEIADLYDCDIDGSTRMNYGTNDRPAGHRVRFGADGAIYKLPPGFWGSELRGVLKQVQDRVFHPQRVYDLGWMKDLTRAK
jgi:hypothetical protein